MPWPDIVHIIISFPHESGQLIQIQLTSQCYRQLRTGKWIHFSKLHSFLRFNGGERILPQLIFIAQEWVPNSTAHKELILTKVSRMVCQKNYSGENYNYIFRTRAKHQASLTINSFSGRPQCQRWVISLAAASRLALEYEKAVQSY